MAPRSAQQPANPVIGFLHPNRPDGLTAQLAAFHQGLGELDFAEGRNLAIEYRWANDQYERLPGLAADLVKRRVAVIVVPAGRCRFHGGLATGPKTAEGKARIAEAQRRR